MTDVEILRKALERYRNVTNDKRDQESNDFYEDVIVFLEKEMEQQMQDAAERIARQKALLKKMYGACGGSMNPILMDREISTSRDRVEQAEGWKKEIEQRVKIIDEFSLSIGKDVQDLFNKHDALSGRVEQLGQMVENKIDQVLNEYGQTLTSFVEEQTGDGGVMTLSRKTASWKLVAECLLTNGYFVCCHFDEEDETITIEYFRA